MTCTSDESSHDDNNNNDNNNNNNNNNNNKQPFSSHEREITRYNMTSCKHRTHTRNTDH